MTQTGIYDFRSSLKHCHAWTGSSYQKSLLHVNEQITGFVIFAKNRNGKPVRNHKAVHSLTCAYKLPSERYRTVGDELLMKKDSFSKWTNFDGKSPTSVLPGDLCRVAFESRKLLRRDLAKDRCFDAINLAIAQNRCAVVNLAAQVGHDRSNGLVNNRNGLEARGCHA